MIITVVEYLLDLVLCEIDVLLIFEIMNRSYGKMKKNNKLIGFIVISLVFIITAYFHYVGNYINTFLNLFVYFCVIGFYPPNFKKKLLFSISLLSTNISALLVLNDITNIFPKVWIVYGIIGYHIIFWMVLYLSARFSENSYEELTPLLWGLLCTVPILCMLATSFTLFLTGYYNGSLKKAALLHLPIQIVFLVINLMVFVLYTEFTKFYSKTKENALLLQQVQYQKQHYKELEMANSKIREIRHEMKNQLKTATYLYEKGSQTELVNYLETSLNHLTDIEQVIHTGNFEMDALINIKLNELDKINAKYYTNILIPSNISFPFNDMVIILGNLFDNAKEACEMLVESERTVYVSICYINQSLLIKMKNPFKEFSPQTQKNDKIIHGLGLKNIERTVKHYNGVVSYSTQNNTFAIDIILYNIL